MIQELDHRTGEFDNAQKPLRHFSASIVECLVHIAPNSRMSPHTAWKELSYKIPKSLCEENESVNS